MTDEVEHLSNTLMWTVGMITQAGPDDLKRVANAYREAQDRACRKFSWLTAC